MAVMTAPTSADAAGLLAHAPSPVVVIPVCNADDDVVCCLESVIAHTAPSVALLVVDDAGVDGRAIRLLKSASASIDHHVVVIEHRSNQGYVKSCNEAFALTPGRDVVLVNSDVIVGAEWLERLMEAAYSSDSVATATTLTNHGTIVSVPYRNVPVRILPDHMTPAEAARRVAAGSRRLRPSIPTAVGHCFYVRRHALDLLGPFDETFDPGYGEEVDFSQRAIAHGFRHVVADDVFTYHRGNGSFGEAAEVVERKVRHDSIVRQRYPAYAPWVQWVAEEPSSTLADALRTARRSLIGLTVGVDALCVGSIQNGTRYNVVETIRALARREEIRRLVAFVPTHAVTEVARVRREVPNVDFVTVNVATDTPERIVDLVYRPYQVNSARELEFLYHVGDRLVVNQLDTIAFENPSYFASHREWLGYRNLTRLSLKLADGVAFTSSSGQRAASSEGLIEPGKPRAVVSCGVDDPIADDDVARPAGCGTGDAGFLLCLGASYLHKNRRFALELWTELRRRGWPERIVLAGPTPPHGNSLARGAELLLTVPELRGGVVTLGAITEAEKRWLYQRAALVLYPSTVEGFGLVPLEAARHGVPTLATRQESLDEVLPPDIPVLDGFDVASGADQAWHLLHDRDAATALTRALLERRQRFTWADTARKLMGLFEDALGQPRSRLLLMGGEGGEPVGLPARGRAASSREGLDRSDVSADVESIDARHQAELANMRHEILRLEAEAADLKGELAAINATRTWRLHHRFERSRLLRWLFTRSQAR